MIQEMSAPIATQETETIKNDKLFMLLILGYKFEPVKCNLFASCYL
jgi:hypothetical protein